MDQHPKRSLPNKAVDVIAANFLAIDCFPRAQLMAPWPWLPQSLLPLVMSLSVYYAATFCTIAAVEA